MLSFSINFVQTLPDLLIPCYEKFEMGLEIYLEIQCLLVFYPIQLGSRFFTALVPYSNYTVMVIRLVEAKLRRKKRRWALYKDGTNEWNSKNAPQAVYCFRKIKNSVNHNGFDLEEWIKLGKANKKGKRIKGAVQLPNNSQKRFFMPARTMSVKAWRHILRS